MLAVRRLRRKISSVLAVFGRFQAFWTFLDIFGLFCAFSDVFGRLELFLFKELSLQSIR